MAHHDRLAMPFERARPQLLFGQLQLRQRHRDAAATTLAEALATFERLETALWAAKARASLARAGTHQARAGVLTTAERRVAELAASGMTNRDVAARCSSASRPWKSTSPASTASSTSIRVPNWAVASTYSRRRETWNSTMAPNL